MKFMKDVRSSSRKTKRMILALLFSCLSPMADAALSCAGQVAYLGVDSGGQVVVANGAGIHAICSTVVQGNYQINTQACKMFYATFLANRLAARPVAIYYNDPALTACAQITNWSTQTSVYFVEQNN